MRAEALSGEQAVKAVEPEAAEDRKKVSRELEMSQPESANRKRQTGRAARRKTTGRR